MQEVISYLEGDGQIAIFDGSNLKKSRRERIMKMVKDHVSFIFGYDVLAYDQYTNLD